MISNTIEPITLPNIIPNSLLLFPSVVVALRESNLSGGA